MHLNWKNCQLAFKGQYHNQKDGKLAKISCEALCDSSLYCWHWLAGRCDTNNDLTVMRYSPLFIDIFREKKNRTSRRLSNQRYCMKVAAVYACGWNISTVVYFC